MIWVPWFHLSCSQPFSACSSSNQILSWENFHWKIASLFIYSSSASWVCHCLFRKTYCFKSFWPILSYLEQVRYQWKQSISWQEQSHHAFQHYFHASASYDFLHQQISNCKRYCWHLDWPMAPGCRHSARKYQSTMIATESSFCLNSYLFVLNSN